MHLTPVCPAYLSDYLVRQEQERRRDGDPECLGGLQVDDQLELHGLLHGQVRGLGALQNLVHIGGSAAQSSPSRSPRTP